MSWYLLSLLTMAYIGPLPEDACKRAAEATGQPFVICKESAAMQICDVNGHPGTFMPCPVFDVPHVTRKEGQ